MNIIMQRDLMTEYRKRKKDELDRIINLSTEIGEPSQRVRLLDDGIVLDGNGDPWFYVRKGTVKKFYESMPDDYEGMITLAHFPFAQFPFSLGSWTKKDLYVEDKGDGFYKMDVDLHLDDESIFVKELRRQKFTVAVSVEMATDPDKRLSKKLGIEVVDDIKTMPVFSIVGNAGNVYSSGINLGGAT